jgi:hypothetical protein
VGLVMASCACGRNASGRSSSGPASPAGSMSSSLTIGRASCTSTTRAGCTSGSCRTQPYGKGLYFTSEALPPESDSDVDLVSMELV